MTVETILLPMAGSLITGTAIGMERELRAKSAGLRTHTIVCFSSTLLMLAAVHQADWLFRPIPGSTIVSDPTRMAHGILTGIGFLGAGVIFRQGNVVHGLTTAASLWITAALGLLYGTGLFALALTGSLATLIVLKLFRMLQTRLLVRHDVLVHVVCAGPSMPTAEALLAVMARHSLKTGVPAFRRYRDQCRPLGQLRLKSKLVMRSVADIERLVSDLSVMAGVIEVEAIPGALCPDDLVF